MIMEKIYQPARKVLTFGLLAVLLAVICVYICANIGHYTAYMEADIASNGEEALKLFEESEVGYYDAILMDRHMPVMDGLQAAKKLRAMEREDAGTVPVIALTGSTASEDVEDSLSAGMNAHLTKPVEPDALFEVLEKLVLNAN